jgi:hypothetical protein
MCTLAPAARGRSHEERQARADRIGEGHVADDAVAEERIGAMARAVDELMGEDDVGRRVLHFQRADRGRRQDGVYAEELEAVDVGAVVDLAGRVAMAASVTGQKGHAGAVDLADHIRIGRCAERRLHRPFVDDGQPFHGVDARASNDADADVRHDLNLFSDASMAARTRSARATASNPS